MGQSPISKMLRYLFLEMFGLRLTTPWFYVVYGDVRVRSAWGFHPQPSSSLRGGLKRRGRNQVTLRFLILVFLCCAWVTIGALPQAPAGNLVPCTLFPLRGGLKRRGWNQVTLRSLILVFLCCAWVTIGALPQAPAGNNVPCTLSPLRGDGSIVTEGKG